MSGHELSRAEVARVRREVRADLSALAKQTDRARDVLTRYGDEPPPYQWMVVGAVALHAWYTGLETLLERALRMTDGDVPAGADGHRRLLSQAMTAIDDLRPALLPDDLESELGSLLAFRHFFRHAYGAELDPEKLRLELQRLVRIQPRVDDALVQLETFLRDTEHALAER